jgi:uncharacterized membrane protein (GlpM family)
VLANSCLASRIRQYSASHCTSILRTVNCIAMYHVYTDHSCRALLRTSLPGLREMKIATVYCVYSVLCNLYFIVHNTPAVP